MEVITIQQVHAATRLWVDHAYLPGDIDDARSIEPPALGEVRKLTDWRVDDTPESWATRMSEWMKCEDHPPVQHHGGGDDNAMLGLFRRALMVTDLNEVADVSDSLYTDDIDDMGQVTFSAWVSLDESDLAMLDPWAAIIMHDLRGDYDEAKGLVQDALDGVDRA